MEICNHLSCTACGACKNVCSKSAISMREDSEGFLYPYIDESSCVNCGLCQKVCPANKDTPVSAATFYMAWHKNDEVLQKSSSGGVFTALADYVLVRNGVVFGAVKNPDTQEVCHIMINNVQDLDKLRLSKYYQSDTKNVYQQIRGLLMQDRFVLFSGTACQVAGLYSALDKWKVNREIIWGGASRRLITADVLCHGCTSRKAVSCYIKTKEKQYKKTIKDYYFRVKTKNVGWQSGGGTRMKLEFSDGTYKVEDKASDTFFVGFNNYLFLRESCYQCKYCGTDRISDFTLADFWGVDSHEVPPKQMLLGVSVMCANTDMAKEMLPELSNSLYIEKIDSQKAIPYNLTFSQPGDRPKIRDSIFKRLENQNFDSVVKHACWKYYLKLDVKQTIKKCIGESRYKKMVSKIKVMVGKA